MKSKTYFKCPSCGYESGKEGKCPKCKIQLVEMCSHCDRLEKECKCEF